MRLYAVVLVIWAAVITASSESNISTSSNEKAVDYTESRDSLVRQIVQPYVTSIEARSSGQTDTEDHSNDVATVAGLSGSPAVRSGARDSNDATTTTDSSSGAVYVTPFAGTASEAYPFGGHLDFRESGYTIPEDVLVVENVGSFGQRVRQGHPADKKATRNTEHRQDDYASYRKSFSSTVSLLDDRDDRGRLYVSSTRKPLELKREQTLAPFSESKIVAFEAFARNLDQVPDVASTTEVRPLDEKNIASNENEPEHFPQPHARSSQGYNDSTNKLAESIEKSENIMRTLTSVEISPSLQLGRFSGPIIVPDLPNERIQDIVVDYDDNVDRIASGTRSFSKNEEKTNLKIDATSFKTAASNGITMSSIMLKPLQVGITLMNADEAALAIDNEQSAATDTDYLQNDLQRLAVADEAGYKRNQSRVNYKDEKLQRVEKKKPQKVLTDNSVEIQKSIEIFHTAPVHEIHYPVEYIRQTSNVGVIETNSIGKAQKWKQSYGQDERSELQSNYDVYQGNDQVEKNVIKAHASTLSERYNRHDSPENKLATSPLIVEYSSNTYEQTPVQEVNSQSFKYNNVQPGLLIPSQSGDASRDQSDQRQSFNADNGVPPRAKPLGNVARQETANKYVKTYVPGTITDTYRAQQPQSSQPIDQQYPFRSPETRQPEAQQQLLLKIIPNESAGSGGFLVPLSRPYAIEKIVEKTVHVPHPVEVEKVIEKTVPFPVERQVPVQVPVPIPVPQPYPVHVQVVPERQIRVQHLYPIHVERRVPYTLVQRPQSSTYPLHLKSSTHVPTAEKTTEKSVAAGVASRPSRPYRADVVRQPSIDNGPVDVTFDKYRQKSNAESILENVVPRGAGELAARPSEVNTLRFHHGDPGHAAGRPLTAYNYISTPHYSDVRLMILPRGYNGHPVTSRPQVVSSLYAVPVSIRRQIAYNLVEKDGSTKGDEYLGPVPVSHKSVPRSKTRTPQYSTNAAAQSQSATTSSIPRKSRQPETRYPGSFRQSKMEYGFKPPMVPSVQYDESTATKVEN